jgi:carboxypeptidase Taq
MTTPPTGTAYQRLEQRFRRLAALGDSAAVLRWDWATMMPAGGAEARAHQLAELQAVRHGLLTAPETAELLAAAEAERDLAPWQRTDLHEMKRLWTHAAALNENLVIALTKATSACETVWREARAASDFAAVLPSLKTVLALVREVAQAKAARLGLAPYDALLDEYEPGGRAADIDRLFGELAGFLPGFLAQVLDHQAKASSVVVPQGPFPIEKQRALGLRLMEILGFDFRHGRLDVSHHPFCGGTPDDVRITTRYDEADFTSSLMAVLHETGHALYERGLPREWRGLPIGEARGMSLHESQSLLIEMQVCRSREFLAFAAPLMREAFDGRGPAWDAENLFRLYTRVQPSFIRVNADEVTYPAHVILRYNLERAMIAGDLAADELPGAWNDGMRRLLGVTPPNDREGCLQDIHWYDGAWGYFPTYTLGAMTAAQLFAAAKAADSSIVLGIARGDFTPLLAWLRDHVHGKGASVSTRALLAQATGRELETGPFRHHLQQRYLL